MFVSAGITGQARSGVAKNLVAQRKTPPQRTLFKGGTVLTLDASIGDFTAADVLVEGSHRWQPVGCGGRSAAQPAQGIHTPA